MNYPNDFINKIICGDCLKVMQGIPDNSIDLVLTDPPWNISESGNCYFRHISTDLGDWDKQWNTNEDFFIWTEKWFAEIVRVLKDNSWIYIFFCKEFVGLFNFFLSKKYNIENRSIFTWIKKNPPPAFRKSCWRSSVEFVWIGSKGSKKIKNFLSHKEMKNYYFSYNKSIWGETNHPAEKPKELIKRFALSSSDKNDIILDPFLGSGTTAVVAKQLGRHYIGIEQDKEFCKISEKRVKETISQKNNLQRYYKI